MPSVGGTAGEAPASLDELIAKAYSRNCRGNQLLKSVDLPEADLRSCVTELIEAGGVSEDSPFGFFAAALLSIWRRRQAGSVRVARSQVEEPDTSSWRRARNMDKKGEL
jgi:hypothetical protein